LGWVLVSSHPPPLYMNVLFAFSGHWNQVAGFRSGDNEFYETLMFDGDRTDRLEMKWKE